MYDNFFFDKVCLHDVRFYCLSQCFHNKTATKQLMLVKFAEYIFVIMYVKMSLIFVLKNTDYVLQVSDFIVQTKCIIIFYLEIEKIYDISMSYSVSNQHGSYHWYKFFFSNLVSL